MSECYDVRRQGWRLECGDSCELRYSGERIQCILVDISISGVLVSCEEQQAERICEGDECGLMLCGKPHSSPREIICHVVRRDAGRIGLQFPEVP